MPAFQPTGAKLRYQLIFEGSWPTSVAFLDSGRRIAAGNQLGQIFVWDLPETPPALDPKIKDRQAPNVWPTRRLDGHTNEIVRLLVTPDGKNLISASLDRAIRVWPIGGAVAGKADVILDGDARRRLARQAGKKEPSTEPSATVQTQSESALLEGHKDWIQTLGMSGDGKRLISGDAVSKVIVWDLASRKPVAQWAGQPWNGIAAAALSHDGQTALVSEYRYKRDDFDIPTPAVKLWNVADGKEKLDLLAIQFPKLNPMDRTYGGSQLWRKFIANGLIAANFSPDGSILAMAQSGETDSGKVHLFETASGKLLRSISGHLSGATDAVFSSDGKYILSTGRDTCVRICQVSDGKESAVLGTPRGGQFKDWFSAVALSPDERTIAVADIAGLVQVWEF